MSFVEQLRGTVAQYGWTKVSMPGGWRQPPWIYSIGLWETYKMPEVVVVGPLSDVMSSIMANVGDAVKSRATIDDGTELADIVLDYKCIFRAIDRKHVKKYLPYAVEYYGNDEFPVLQCVWPDSWGRYPWQPQFDNQVKGLQQVLFKV